MSNNESKKDIDIQLDEETAEGTYSNLVMINHSHSEFVLDFISILPGVPKARVKSRIILTPQHAKSFLRALEDNLEKFEKVNGKISGGDSVAVPLNFGPTGKA